MLPQLVGLWIPRVAVAVATVEMTTVSTTAQHMVVGQPRTAAAADGIVAAVFGLLVMMMVMMVMWLGYSSLVSDVLPTTHPGMSHLQLVMKSVSRCPEREDVPAKAFCCPQTAACWAWAVQAA